jgi:Papain-like cysteine protease AvrRpt2
MTVTINYNALGGSMDDRTYVEAIMIACNGGTGLAMEDSPLAQSVKFHQGDDAWITHRRFLSYDKELWLHVTPDEWLDIVEDDAANGVLVQCHNEPRIGEDNVEEFVAWMVACIRIAHSRGIRLAPCAFAVGNPHEALIENGAFDDLLMELGPDDALMVHEYFQDHPLAEPEAGWLCFRLEYWMERMVLLETECRTIIVGEYGRDIGGGKHDGWRDTGWTAQQYAHKCEEGLLEYWNLSLLYDIDVYINIFCAGHGAGNDWQSFNVEGVVEIEDMIMDWNNEHSEDGFPMPSPPAELFDMMLYVCPPGSKKFRLFGMGDEAMQCTQEQDGWVLQRKNELSEEFQVTDIMIKRGADTSMLYTDDGKYHGQFYIQWTDVQPPSYGADWCPRLMRQGETFARNPRIRYYDWKGNILNDYVDHTTLHFLRWEQQHTFLKSGITVPDVVVLSWANEEEYYYAKNYGLVGWKNLVTKQESFIGSYDAVNIRNPVSHPIPRPQVPYPPPAKEEPVYPPGENPIRAVVNLKDGISLRVEPDAQAFRIRVIPKGEEVTLYTAPTVQADGYAWLRVHTDRNEDGWSAQYVNGADSFIPAPEPVPPSSWIVHLDVPYVNQKNEDPTANLSQNDCGVASMLMMQRYFLFVETALVASIPTVDDLVPYTALKDPTVKGLGFKDIIRLANQLGFNAYSHTPCPLEVIRGFLDELLPVMCLLDYKQFNPAHVGNNFSHFAVAIGYNETHFLFHDPYEAGPNYSIANAQLQDAMTGTPGNSPETQGMVLR